MSHEISEGKAQRAVGTARAKTLKLEDSLGE